jgi:hypothetical protein
MRLDQALVIRDQMTKQALLRLFNALDEEIQKKINDSFWGSARGAVHTIGSGAHRRAGGDDLSWRCGTSLARLKVEKVVKINHRRKPRSLEQRV